MVLNGDRGASCLPWEPSAGLEGELPSCPAKDCKNLLLIWFQVHALNSDQGPLLHVLVSLWPPLCSWSCSPSAHVSTGCARSGGRTLGDLGPVVKVLVHSSISSILESLRK